MAKHPNPFHVRNGCPTPAAARSSAGAEAPEPSARLFADLQLAVEYVSPASLTGYKGNARRHSRRQVEQIAASIQAFGFVSPLLVDAAGEIIAGHGRLAAAKRLGLAHLPIVRIEHLDDAQRRALRIADNKLAELAGWDEALLALEFKSLVDLDLTLDLSFDLTITGFAAPEIDRLVSQGERQSATSEDDRLPDPAASGVPVSTLGDVFALGEHRIVCGDAPRSRNLRHLAWQRAGQHGNP